MMDATPLKLGLEAVRTFLSLVQGGGGLLLLELPVLLKAVAREDEHLIEFGAAILKQIGVAGVPNRVHRRIEEPDHVVSASVLSLTIAQCEKEPLPFRCGGVAVFDASLLENPANLRTRQAGTGIAKSPTNTFEMRLIE
jgi:hypothetical protein